MFISPIFIFIFQIWKIFMNKLLNKKKSISPYLKCVLPSRVVERNDVEAEWFPRDALHQHQVRTL